MKKLKWFFVLILFFSVNAFTYAEVHLTNFFTLSGDIAFTLVPGKNNAYDLNKNNFYNPFSPAHIFLYSSLRLADNLFIIGDFLVQTEESARIIGLYLVYSPFNRTEFNLKIGMIPTPFGNFSPRAYPHSNFLIGYPLMRQYQTGLSYEEFVNDITDLIQNKEKRHDKISPIDEIYWDSGFQLFGQYKNFEYSFGFTQGALSWPEPLEDKTPAKQLIGRIGFKPNIGLCLGFSYAKGNYFELSSEHSPDSDGTLSEKVRAEDFEQEAYGFDYHFSKEYLIIQGELLFTSWKSPPIQDNLPAYSFYGEMRYKVFPNLYLAARYDELNFDEVKNEKGERVRWDSNARRIELGLNYSLAKDLALRISYQSWKIFSSPQKRYNQFAAQVNYHF